MRVFFCFLVVLLVCVSHNAKAEGCENPYVVKKDDTLWDLWRQFKKEKDPTHWDVLIESNPKIIDEGNRWRFDDHGRIIVYIHPGETLCGLKDVERRLQEAVAPSVPIEERISEEEMRRKIILERAEILMHFSLVCLTILLVVVVMMLRRNTYKKVRYPRPKIEHKMPEPTHKKDKEGEKK